MAHQPSDECVISLPRTLHEAYKLHLSKAQHPAVKMFGSSIQAHRSCNEAIIFLYGVSGAGKSSTLNHLFGTEIVLTSDREACTDSVTEWVSTLTSDHWKVSNLEVGFIDMPGWNDPKGKDETNFALIQHFLTIHPILGSKIRKFYPNIVLLVFNSNDNRMIGDESNAEKMLLALSKLDIVDRKRQNVVIVLTHVCSHPSIDFEPELEELSEIYQNLSRSCLGVYPPVVWLENNSSFELKREGDWTLLYDGTAQPLNLYEALKSLMTDANDEIGKEALRLFFKNRAKITPIERLKVNSQKIDVKTRKALQEHWLRTFSENSPTYKSSELTKYLLFYLQSQKEIKLSGRDIQGLLITLTYSTSFPNVKSIKGKSLGSVQEKLFPYPLTLMEKLLLINALDLIIPKSPECLDVLGKGYNVMREEICLVDIFEYSESKYLDSFLNCFITKSKRIHPCKTNRITFGSYDTNTSSAVRQLKEIQHSILDTQIELNLRMLQITKLLDKIKNRIDEIKKSGLLFWIESGLFLVELNFPRVKLSKNFCDVIDSLPELSLDKNGDIEKQYLTFLNTYGHFIIANSIGGGMIEGNLKIDYEVDPAKYLSKVQSMLQVYIELMKDGYNWKDYADHLSPDDTKILKELDSAPLLWLAGDQAYTSNCLENLSHSNFTNWLLSLKQSSILFDYSFTLIPIYFIIQSVNVDKANQIKIAFDKLVSDKDTRIYYDGDDIRVGDLGSKFAKRSSELKQPSFEHLPKALSRHIICPPENLTSAKPLDFKLQLKIIPDRLKTAENDKTNIAKLGNACFSVESHVILKNGQSIKMKDLKIGDHILSLDMRTHKPVYSKVYMWGHLDPDLTATFIEIHYEGGLLRLTENHLLLSGHDMSFTTASRVRRGDVVYCIKMTNTQSMRTQSLRIIKVESVNQVKLTGVYAPFTHNSLIVVDGLVCSAFAIPDLSITKFDQFERMSRICMSPMRLIDSMGLTRIVRKPISQSTKLHYFTQSLLCFFNLLPVNNFFKGT